MTDTVLSSASREVVIGFDRPFVMIGERINPTGRKRLAAEMVAGDFSTVLGDALAQVEAGAHMLDVNAGIPLADVETIKAKRPDVEIFVYPGAQHGFHCDERASYDKASADIAWPRSMAFFAKHLK